MASGRRTMEADIAVDMSPAEQRNFARRMLNYEEDSDYDPESDSSSSDSSSSDASSTDSSPSGKRSSKGDSSDDDA